MAKVVIDIDSRGAVRSLKQIGDEAKKTDKNIQGADKSTKSLTSTLLKIGASTAGLYAVGRAFTSLIRSSFEYNMQMDASESKLRAMISGSKDWVTTAGKQVTATERMAIVNRDTTKTLDLLTTANSETAMGMTELIDVYALMKPAMDMANVSTADQVEVLKLVTNAASNFGMGAQELASGIDDLASGTWATTSGFGKMAKSLGITKEEIKATSDVAGYLKEKLKDVGQAQLNWGTAVSNFGVAWDTMAGKITEPVFKPAKEAIQILTKYMGEYGVKASEALGKAFAAFAALAVRVIGRVIQSISGLISAVQIAAKGIAMLGQSAKGIGAKIGQTLGETASWWGDALGVDMFKKAGKEMEDFYTPALNNSLNAIKDLNKEVQDIAASQGNFNDMLGGIVGGFETYSAESGGPEQVVGDLADKASVSEAADKAGKKIGGNVGRGIKKGIKDAKVKDKITEEMKAAQRAADSFASAVGYGFSDLFNGLVSGTENWGETFKRVTQDILNQLTQILVIQPMVEGMSGLFGSSFSGLSMFASGGVVNSPTFFSDNGRLSVAGEAGAEVIAPLRRDSSGNMGVAAVAPNVNVNVVNNAGVDVDVRQDEEGQIEIILAKVVDSINRGGVVGNSISSRYGLRRV